MLDSAAKGFTALAMAAFTVSLIGGCADGGKSSLGTTSSTLAANGATLAYVLQQPSNSNASYIYQYSLTSSSSATPSLIITPPSDLYATAIATDANGQLYVGGESLSTGQAEILVYPVNSAGIASNTIYGGSYYGSGSTTFVVPQTMTAANGVLYIGSFDQSQVYLTALPTGATGSPTPTLQLTGTNTQLNDPLGIAVDATGNMYVSQDTTSDTGQVLYFSAGSTGNVAPGRSITNALVPYGLALDTSGNLYAALDSYNGASAGSIVEFAAGASGAATPTKTISGTYTGLYLIGGLRLDAVGNLYAVNISSSYAVSLLGFSPSGSGNVAPTFSLSSSLWNSPSSELAIH